MKHEAIHELLALSLYGELDGADERELARHLETCPDCTRFATELRAGVGALARSRGSEPEPALPLHWRARLDAACRAESHRRVAPWWSAVAGFAAGIALAIALSTRMREGESTHTPRVDPAVASDASAYARFKSDAAPPLANTGGPLEQLSRYLKR